MPTIVNQFPEVPECTACDRCDFPQKLNDECCRIALGREDDVVGRDGTYHPHCPHGKVCCKCSASSYTCIDEHDVCTESSCQEECPVIKDLETPNLLVSEINEPGFGNISNKYSLAMATFGEHVYVGTLNAPGFPLQLPEWFLGEPLNTFGAKIYRGKIGSGGEWEWENIFDWGLPARNTNNFGVRKMKVVGAHLYAATANHEGTSGNGVEIWSTADGVNWLPKNVPGFGEPENISGRSIHECGGYLYVGVENRVTGAQLWRRALLDNGDLDDTSTWESVPAADGGFGRQNNYFISELVSDPFVPNQMFAGSLNGFEGMELWSIESCDADLVDNVGVSNVFEGGWVGPPGSCPLPPVTIPQIGPIDLCITNSGVLSLETANTNFGPALFVGTVNYLLGASLFVRFAQGPFVPIFLFGDGNDRLSYVWSMQEYKGRIYIGTFGRPNLRNLLGLPDFTFDINNINMGEMESNLEMLLDNGFSPEGLFPAGIGNALRDIDLDDVIESGEHTLFSIDLFGFNQPTRENPFPVEVSAETRNSFGSCYPYGIRTMAVLDDTLVLGSAGASSDGGTLVFGATERVV